MKLKVQATVNFSIEVPDNLIDNERFNLLEQFIEEKGFDWDMITYTKEKDND